MDRLKFLFLNYYFRLQFLRLKRDIIGFGINPYAGIGFYILAFLAISEMIFRKVNDAPVVYTFLSIGITYTLGNETRNGFMKSIFPPAKYNLLRLLENLFCVIPFSLFLLFKHQILAAFITLVLCGILSQFNKAGRTRFQIPSPFSKHPYEFTTGFRRSFLLILGIYSLTAISIYYHNPNLGLLTILGIYLVCFTFYSTLDPVYYVWIHAQSAKAFLKRKIIVGLLYGFSLGLPVFIALIIAFPENILTAVLLIFTGSLYIMLGIVGAYTQFPKMASVSQRFQIVLSICFPPLLLIVIPNLYFQAVNRLKPCLTC